MTGGTWSWSLCLYHSWNTWHRNIISTMIVKVHTMTLLIRVSSSVSSAFYFTVIFCQCHIILRTTHHLPIDKLSIYASSISLLQDAYPQTDISHPMLQLHDHDINLSYSHFLFSFSHFRPEQKLLHVLYTHAHNYRMYTSARILAS